MLMLYVSCFSPYTYVLLFVAVQLDPGYKHSIKDLSYIVLTYGSRHLKLMGESSNSYIVGMFLLKYIIRGVAENNILFLVEDCRGQYK